MRKMISMKYKDLKENDLFIINRENTGVVYRKKSFYFEEVQNQLKAYRKLWGGTNVTKIER